MRASGAQTPPLPPLGAPKRVFQWFKRFRLPGAWYFPDSRWVFAHSAFQIRVLCASRAVKFWPCDARPALPPPLPPLAQQWGKRRTRLFLRCMLHRSARTPPPPPRLGFEVVR